MPAAPIETPASSANASLWFVFMDFIHLDMSLRIKLTFVPEEFRLLL
jgi:hypothetical protein